MDFMLLITNQMKKKIFLSIKQKMFVINFWMIALLFVQVIKLVEIYYMIDTLYGQKKITKIYVQNKFYTKW